MEVARTIKCIGTLNVAMTYILTVNLFNTEFFFPNYFMIEK